MLYWRIGSFLPTKRTARIHNKACSSLSERCTNFLLRMCVCVSVYHLKVSIAQHYNLTVHYNVCIYIYIIFTWLNAVATTVDSLNIRYIKNK